MNNKSHRNVSGDSGRYCFDGSHKLFGVFKIVRMSSVKIFRQLSLLSDPIVRYKQVWLISTVEMAYLQTRSKL